MKKIITIIAYIWAIICVLLIPLTFIGNANFAKQFSKLPFMKVNPKYTGGQVARTIKEGSLTTYIYNPVFDALIGKSSKGFVQIKFSDTLQLPATIDKKIDYDNDGKPDFRLIINTITNNTGIEILNDNVLNLNISSKVKKDWIVRVNIKNK
jgi:hypothetical protein